MRVDALLGHQVERCDLHVGGERPDVQIVDVDDAVERGEIGAHRVAVEPRRRGLHEDVELTRDSFEMNGIKNALIIAPDGQAALDYLEQATELPRVVLRDLKLPKVDGLEVLQQIRARERTRMLPVVVMTTSREERDLVESYRLGANGYVRKPVGVSEFYEAVRALGLFWLLLNESPRA